MNISALDNCFESSSHAFTTHLPKSFIGTRSIGILQGIFEEMYPTLGYVYEAHIFTIYDKKHLPQIVSAMEVLANKLIDRKTESRQTVDGLYVPKVSATSSELQIHFTPISAIESTAVQNARTVALQKHSLLNIFIGSLIDKITLFSGKEIGKEEFIQHPLFINTKEKQNVFFDLYLFLHSESSFEEYQNFLLNLDREEWFDLYWFQPKMLAHLSLLAFLDGRIDEEELFVIHIVAEAFNEQNELDVAIQSVPPSAIVDYLEESGFPLFSLNHPDFMVINRKPLEELEREKEHFLERYRTLCPVKRTFVEYILKPFVPDRAAVNARFFSIEMSMHYHAKSSLGFKNIKGGEQGTVVLPPPKLAIDLYCATSSIETIPSSAQTFMFGFSEDDTVFYSGARVCSIPSPLFPLPYVHEFSSGPSGLGLLAHDILYHMPLDANNPHILLFIEIAKKLKKRPSEMEEVSEKEHLANAELASHLIDREANEYRYLDAGQAFWPFIIRGVIAQKSENLNRAEFEKWCERTVYPSCIQALQNIEIAVQEGLFISLRTFKMMLIERIPLRRVRK